MIEKNVKKILNELPQGVMLVVAAKTRTPEEIIKTISAGVKNIGENYVQEAINAFKVVGKKATWHFIGHLQTNKVKYIAGFVHLIHAVDSMKLLKEINKQALKHNRVINCLLQFHIAKEESKFGYDLSEAMEMLNSDEFNNLEGVNIVGVMGMATFTNNAEQLKKEFDYLKSTFDTIKTEYPEVNILSMGMSGDYELAIDCGSNMIRVGSSIFGTRNYSI